MYKLIGLILALTSSGCAAVRYLNADGMTASERREAQLQAQRDYESSEAERLENAKIREEALQEGATLKQITDVWGAPDRREMNDGVLIYWYQNEDKPIYLGFRSNKLVMFVYDNEQVIAQRRAEQMAMLRRQTAAQESAAESSNRAANAAAWSAIFQMRQSNQQR